MDADMDEGALVGIESTIMALGQGAAASAQGSPPPASTAKERYARRGVLGEGGMGRVERVWDSDLMREVAVKEIRPELGGDPRLLEQFLWEARVTAYLDHPNIVPVHDLGVRHGRLYFTMKFVRGSSLEQWIARVAADPELEAELSLARRLRAFLQLCNAVAFAHSRGVLHRDLKPANLMLGAHGEVLVSDWGLALPLPGDAGELLRAQMPDAVRKSGSGTPVYMSPEQVHELELDARSDVYALGTILYELVELARPFDAKTVPAILLKVANGEVRPTTRAAPSLAAVIARAMAVDKQARYASAGDLAKDVETVLDGRTPSAESASVVKQAARYYLGRDPALAKLKVWQIDLWLIGSALGGLTLGLVLSSSLGFAWWIALALGIAVSLPPTIAWYRLRNDQPG